MLPVLPVPQTPGRSPRQRGQRTASHGPDRGRSGPSGGTATEGKDAFNGDEKCRGFGAGAARSCSRERPAAPTSAKLGSAETPLCRSVTGASLRDGEKSILPLRGQSGEPAGSAPHPDQSPHPKEPLGRTHNILILPLKYFCTKPSAGAL